MSQAEPTPSDGVQWQDDFAVGHPLIDTQHQGLLAQCQRLAELCAASASGAGETESQTFDLGFDKLKALVREHLAAEAALLTACGHGESDDAQDERDEFDYLCEEVATTEKFDRPELQRFLALWCIGHIQGSVETLRVQLAGAGTAG